MEFLSPDTIMSFLRNLTPRELRKFINELSPQSYNNLVEAVGLDQLYQLLKGLPSLEYLPPEIRYMYISTISDPQDIINLFNIHNKELYEDLSYGITHIGSGRPVPVGIIHRLRNLETIRSPIYIKGESHEILLEEARKIATLPRLKEATLIYFTNLSYHSVLNCLKSFVDEYSRGTYSLVMPGESYEVVNNRNFSQSDLNLYFTLNSIHVPHDELNINLSLVPHILKPAHLRAKSIFELPYRSYSPNSNSPYIVDILNIYRQYNPLPAFDLSFVGNWGHINDGVVDYLKKIEELEYLSIPYEYLARYENQSTELWLTGQHNIGILINMLGEKLKGIYFRGDRHGEIVEDYVHFDIAPNENIKIFNLPVFFEELPAVLRMFPRLEEIFIIMPHPDQHKINKLLSYTQLQIINIYTSTKHYHLLTSPRFRKVLGYVSYANMQH